MTRPLSAEEEQKRLQAVRDGDAAGLTRVQIAQQLGMARPGTLNQWLATKGYKYQRDTLEAVGYDLSNVAERTPRDAWDAGKGTFERVISDALQKQWRQIKRGRGPFVIYHCTDQHLDGDSCPLRLLEADIQASHDLGAIMAHGGDLLNNWPMAGKLAKMWAEQQCTKSDALLRAEYFMEIFKPDVWVDGNHEEMNPYLEAFFKSRLPASCLADYWSIGFEVITPDGRPVRVKLSHKFEKGQSWFHPHHGAIRETLEADPADLYIEGHYHVSGVMYRTFAERSLSATYVASAGYKPIDKWATRISRGGKVPKLKGRAHWIVCDPMADEGEITCMAFDSPRQAEAYLNGLQNLRAA